jgi:hypothetical protein
MGKSQRRRPNCAHHGAENANCAPFIKAVSPKWVVVSAGRKHRHPRAVAMNRYLVVGLPADHILRTKRGDDEGEEEWDYLRVEGCKDGPGDNDIEIVLNRDATHTVAYAVPHDADEFRYEQ